MFMVNTPESLFDYAVNSARVTVFTGAGISTLSGIPDFRGKAGVYRQKWHGMEVEEILSLPCFLRHPEYFYEWAQTFVYGLENYQPNIVHKTIAEWEKRGLIDATYTQNIDILHQHAGSSKLYELHGSPAHHDCLACRKYFSYNDIAPIVQSGRCPRCECGGIIKPRIVFYGEQLDGKVLEQAYKDFLSSDLTLVLGSSLTVHPAAGLPQLTLRGGGKIAIVNSQPTALDERADWKFDDLQAVFEKLSEF